MSNHEVDCWWCGEDTRGLGAPCQDNCMQSRAAWALIRELDIDKWKLWEYTRHLPQEERFALHTSAVAGKCRSHFLSMHKIELFHEGERVAAGSAAHPPYTQTALSLALNAFHDGRVRSAFLHQTEVLLDVFIDGIEAGALAVSVGVKLSYQGEGA